MKKCVIISDSFKGSISSIRISEIFKESVLSVFPSCDVIQIPIGDGGEGTIDAVSFCVEGKYITCKSKGPNFEDIKTNYYLSNDNVAYIELASCAGLPLVQEKNPMITTTYGVGLLMKDALQNHAKKIVIALGGSCTIDGGCGALTALGVKFYNNKNESFIPVGGTIQDIKDFDIKNVDENIHNCEIILLCDVENKMLGVQGAAHVFGPQKGATPEMVDILENNLNHLNELFKQKRNIDASKINKTGAAGAFAAGMYAVFNAKLESGIKYMLELTRFEDKLKECDLVFTGEGKLDSQSMNGKVISGVLELTKRNNIPVIVIAGGVTSDGEQLIHNDSGIKAIFTTNRLPMNYENVIPYSEDFYKKTIDNIMRLIEIAYKIK